MVGLLSSATNVSALTDAGQARRGRANVNFDQSRADPTGTHVDPVAGYAWGHRRPEQAATQYNIINGQTSRVIPPVIDRCTAHAPTLACLRANTRTLTCALAALSLRTLDRTRKLQPWSLLRVQIARTVEHPSHSPPPPLYSLRAVRPPDTEASVRQALSTLRSA
jgi:hypothetical protein